MKTAMTRAEKLASTALKGFKLAHSNLTKANELLEKERAESLAAAEQWQREIEAYIKECEEATKAAEEAHARNERRIAKIADFLEI